MASAALPPPVADLKDLRIDHAAKQQHNMLRWRWPMLVIILLSGGAGLWFYQSILKRPPSVQVAFARLVKESASVAGPVLSGAGYIVSRDRYISIGVRVPGRIDVYEVEEGDTVRKGDVLVRLDNRDYQAALRKAEASLALAKANLFLRHKQAGRIRELHEQELIATQQLDIAENDLAVAQATVQQAEADVALAKVNLDYTTLKAPTDGIVLAKLKEVGEIAVPGGFAGAGDLIRIANLNDLRGEVDINEVDFHRVKMGQRVEVVPDAYPDRKYPAQVVKIYPQVNRQKGTFKVEVKLAKSDEYLRPDMSVRINFLVDVPQNDPTLRVIVPKVAVRGDSASPFVWTVRVDHVWRVPVQIGADFGDMIEITSGLADGEALVVSGAEDLHEGMQVTEAN